MRKFGPVMMLAVVLVFVLGAVALAADVVPDPVAALLQETVIVFGTVTVGWLSIQRGVIHVLKGFKLGDRPFLRTPSEIWLANGVLAVVGLTIASTLGGQSIWAALLQAALAFFGASGAHEFNSVVGKGKNLTGTESTA